MSIFLYLSISISFFFFCNHSIHLYYYYIGNPSCSPICHFFQPSFDVRLLQLTTSFCLRLFAYVSDVIIWYISRVLSSQTARHLLYHQCYDLVRICLAAKCGGRENMQCILKSYLDLPWKYSVRRWTFDYVFFGNISLRLLRILVLIRLNVIIKDYVIIAPLVCKFMQRDIYADCNDDDKLRHKPLSSTYSRGGRSNSACDVCSDVRK